MNANELADKLLKNNLVSWGKCTPEEHDTSVWTNDQAATMLRQQQAEIEDLKSANRFIQNFAEEQHQRAVALEMRELTDKEIEQVRIVIMGVAYWCADENMPEAYNAVKVCCSEVLEILRKAQEK
jgi:hypothetical protein